MLVIFEASSNINLWRALSLTWYGGKMWEYGWGCGKGCNRYMTVGQKHSKPIPWFVGWSAIARCNGPAAIGGPWNLSLISGMSTAPGPTSGCTRKSSTRPLWNLRSMQGGTDWLALSVVLRSGMEHDRTLGTLGTFELYPRRSEISFAKHAGNHQYDEWHWKSCYMINIMILYN